MPIILILLGLLALATMVEAQQSVDLRCRMRLDSLAITPTMSSIPLNIICSRNTDVRLLVGSRWSWDVRFFDFQSQAIVAQPVLSAEPVDITFHLDAWDTNKYKLTYLDVQDGAQPNIVNASYTSRPFITTYNPAYESTNIVIDTVLKFEPGQDFQPYVDKGYRFFIQLSLIDRRGNIIYSLGHNWKWSKNALVRHFHLPALEYSYNEGFPFHTYDLIFQFSNVIHSNNMFWLLVEAPSHDYSGLKTKFQYSKNSTCAFSNSRTGEFELVSFDLDRVFLNAPAFSWALKDQDLDDVITVDCRQSIQILVPAQGQFRNIHPDLSLSMIVKDDYYGNFGNIDSRYMTISTQNIDF